MYRVDKEFRTTVVWSKLNEKYWALPHSVGCEKCIRSMEYGTRRRTMGYTLHGKIIIQISISLEFTLLLEQKSSRTLGYIDSLVWIDSLCSLYYMVPYYEATKERKLKEKQFIVTLTLSLCTIHYKCSYMALHIHIALCLCILCYQRQYIVLQYYSIPARHEKVSYSVA